MPNKTLMDSGVITKEIEDYVAPSGMELENISLREENTTLKTENEALKAENTSLRTRIAFILTLEDEVKTRVVVRVLKDHPEYLHSDEFDSAFEDSVENHK